MSSNVAPIGAKSARTDSADANGTRSTRPTVFPIGASAKAEIILGWDTSVTGNCEVAPRCYGWLPCLK